MSGIKEIKDEYLTEMQMQTLARFVRGQKVPSICRDLGLTETTLYRWMKKPAYRKMVNRLLVEAQEAKIRSMLERAKGNAKTQES